MRSRFRRVTRRMLLIRTQSAAGTTSCSTDNSTTTVRARLGFPIALWVTPDSNRERQLHDGRHWRAALLPDEVRKCECADSSRDVREAQLIIAEVDIRANSLATALPILAASARAAARVRSLAPRRPSTSRSSSTSAAGNCSSRAITSATSSGSGLRRRRLPARHITSVAGTTARRHASRSQARKSRIIR